MTMNIIFFSKVKFDLLDYFSYFQDCSKNPDFNFIVCSDPEILIRQNLVTNYIITTWINIFMTPISIQIGTLSLVNFINSNILNSN